MIDKIIIYSKPVNKYNLGGRFYNVYRNKNTNLDLSSLQDATSIGEKNQNSQGTFNNIKYTLLKDQILKSNSAIPLTSQKEILISKEDWEKLLQLHSIQNQILEEYRIFLSKFLDSYREYERKTTSILAEQQQLFQRLKNQRKRSGRE